MLPIQYALTTGSIREEIKWGKRGACIQHHRNTIVPSFFVICSLIVAHLELNLKLD